MFSLTGLPIRAENRVESIALQRKIQKCLQEIETKNKHVSQGQMTTDVNQSTQMVSMGLCTQICTWNQPVLTKKGKFSFFTDTIH